MQQNIHGGDIYSRQIRLDFSVNGNPLGMPAEARLSLLAAINHVGEYPDAAAGELTETVSHMLSVQSGREIPGSIWYSATVRQSFFWRSCMHLSLKIL